VKENKGMNRPILIQANQSPSTPRTPAPNV
jgi:hypothetical protein